MVLPVMIDDAHFRLETPENVELEFEPAGPGSRFCAICIDWALMAAVGLVVVLILGAADVFSHATTSSLHLFDEHGRLVASWTLALMILIFAFGTSFYHLLFELFMHGQTPGKRALKLRAISDDGTSMTPGQVLTRNLVRTVDFLPALYVVGGIAALFSRANQRLGDHAAGTLVVKERELDYRARSDARNVTVELSVEEIANVELTAAERRLIARFLSRRHELLPEARWQLADDIARQLYARHGGQADDAEQYLERLAAGVQHAHDSVRTEQKPQ